MNDSCEFGDIVLLKFPFTDGTKTKKRPALIINDLNDGDIIVCRITSHIYNTKNDIFINEWEKAGLKLPSVIRVHKIATLDKELIDTNMGQINESTEMKVEKTFTKRTY